MTWAQGTLAPFDTETSGVDPATCRLVSATVAEELPGHDPHLWEFLVAVDEPIPAEATAVHGITTERARADGRQLAEVVERVTAHLNAAWALGQPVVGMNLAFDFTVLDQEARRCGLPRLKIAGPVIDVYVIDKAVDRYRKGKRTLSDLAAFYGVPFTGAHDASADALAAAGVARVMSARAGQALVDPDAVAALYADRRFPREMARGWQRLAGMSHAELFRQQQRWAAEQASSFATYLKGEAAKTRNAAGEYDEGDPDGVSLLAQAAELSARAASVSRDWPVRVAVPGDCGCSGSAHP
jgi:DNA polymerase-3 subunit epsilon